MSALFAAVHLVGFWHRAAVVGVSFVPGINGDADLLRIHKKASFAARMLSSTA